MSTNTHNQEKLNRANEELKLFLDFLSITHRNEVLKAASMRLRLFIEGREYAKRINRGPISLSEIVVIYEEAEKKGFTREHYKKGLQLLESES